MLSDLVSIVTAITIVSWPHIHSRMEQSLNYPDTHTDTKLKYVASAMYLWIHSDIYYLNDPKACSRAGGYF